MELRGNNMEGSEGTGDSVVKSSRRTNCLTAISHSIVGGLENFFFRWGICITEKPWYFIIGCLVLVGVSSIGLLFFKQENRPTKLWIPQNSGFVQNTDWLQENFPTDLRIQMAIFEAENILTPEGLIWMMETQDRIETRQLSDGTNWNSICFKIPVIENESTRRQKRSPDDPSIPDPGDSFDEDLNFDFGDFDSAFDETAFNESDSAFSTLDPSVELSQGLYCEIITTFEEACFQNSILELWGYDMKKIRNQTQDDILNVINEAKISKLTGVTYNHLLGDIKRNQSGHITGAKSAMNQLFIKIDLNAIHEGTSNDVGTGELVDARSLDWEAELIAAFKASQKVSPPGHSLYFSVARSFGDISSATILGDVRYLVVGFMVLFIYVLLMLGKFDLVEHRIYLSLVGIFSVAMAIFTSYGICSIFGVFYGPVHSILPFLLLGIGIDDMFVIMQCWNNLSPEEQVHSLPIRVGTALKHAGVSITVTSVTDFVAFAIGASTLLPSLQSFCIYAAIGVIGTYVFQATFFVACFTLDQRRIEARRDGLIPCIVHSSPKVSRWKEVAPLQNFFTNKFSKWIVLTPVKALIIVIALGILGVNTWGTVLMRQEFNPIWFIPTSTYLAQFFSSHERLYPSHGERATVYFGSMSYNQELLKIEEFIEELRNQTDIIRVVDPWYDEFKAFVRRNHDLAFPTSDVSDAQFSGWLRQFLFSQSGAKYMNKFKFNGTLRCLDSVAPDILVSSFDFQFKPFSGPPTHLPAMHRVKKMVENINFTTSDGMAFIWARAFASWETDEVIGHELYRNLAIAMACVFLTTLILIADLKACLLVLLCVILTLVNVNGTMHFWGLTIDTVSCINLVLAIGLCVDYAAHIAHTFMVQREGTRNERTRAAVSSMGPAVFHGGFSTFLAFIFLADSDSHVFTTFFKIFVLVVMYGLFHGLVVLPVILSLLGPEPYEQHYEEDLAVPTSGPSPDYKESEESLVFLPFGPADKKMVETLEPTWTSVVIRKISTSLKYPKPEKTQSVRGSDVAAKVKSSPRASSTDA